MKIQIYIEDSLIDTDKDVTFALTRTYEQLWNPSNIINTYSKTVSLPGTANNDIMFNHFYNNQQTEITYNQSAPAIGLNFDPTKRLDMRLMFNGSTLLSGYAKLNRVISNNGQHRYEMTLYSTLNKIYQDLQKMTFFANQTDDPNKYLMEWDEYDMPCTPEVVAENLENDLAGYGSTSDVKAKEWDNLYGFALTNSIADTFDATSIVNSRRSIYASSENFLGAGNEFSVLYAQEQTQFKDVLEENETFMSKNYNAETIVGEGFKPRDIGQFRCYDQQPFFWTAGFMKTFFHDVEDRLGYKFVFENAQSQTDYKMNFFQKNNPYWSESVFLAKPLFVDSDDEVVSNTTASPSKQIKNNAYQAQEFELDSDILGKFEDDESFLQISYDTEIDVLANFQVGDYAGNYPMPEGNYFRADVIVRALDAENEEPIDYQTGPGGNNDISHGIVTVDTFYLYTDKSRRAGGTDRSENGYSTLVHTTNEEMALSSNLPRTGINAGQNLEPLWSEEIGLGTYFGGQLKDSPWYGTTGLISPHYMFRFRVAGTSKVISKYKLPKNTARLQVILRVQPNYAMPITGIVDEYTRYGGTTGNQTFIGHRNTKLTYRAVSGGARAGMICSVKDIWNPDWKPFDVILNYFKMFRIGMYQETADSKVIHIQRIPEYFHKGLVMYADRTNHVVPLDWTDKVDFGKDYIIEPIHFSDRYMLFNYKDNNSGLYEEYTKKYKFDVGEYRLDTNYQFNENTQELLKQPLPCCATYVPNVLRYDRLRDFGEVIYRRSTQEWYPYLQDEDDKYVDNFFGAFMFTRHVNARAVDTELGPIYITGDTAVERANNNDSYIDENNTDFGRYAVEISYARRLSLRPEVYGDYVTDQPKKCGLICYSMPQEIWTSIQEGVNDNQMRDRGGIFNMFWSNYINERYRSDTKKLTCYMRLSLSDYNGYQFYQFVKIRNVLYHVLRIVDFDVAQGATKLTKVELVEVHNPNNYLYDKFMNIG